MKTIIVLVLLSIIGVVGLNTYKDDIIALIEKDPQMAETVQMPEVVETTPITNETNLDEAEAVVIQESSVDSNKNKNNSELVGVKLEN